MTPQESFLKDERYLSMTLQIPIGVMTPARNYVAPVLVARLCHARLRAEGLLTEDRATGTGELNASLYLFFVSDISKTVAALRDELQSVGLGGFAAFSYFCPAEQIWRDANTGNVAIDPGVLRKEWGAELEDIARALGLFGQ